MPTSTFEPEGYVIEDTPSESSYGGVLIYNDNHINNKVHKIHEGQRTWIIFHWNTKPNSKNTIIGCIYQQPWMDSTEFNDVYLHDVLEKLSNENKTVVLMGNFNIDLLKYDSDIDSPPS